MLDSTRRTSEVHHSQGLIQANEVDDSQRWYVVCTQPHREFAAEKQLGAQGFNTFLPRYRKTVRHARRLTSVTAAFFPRYLFVRLDLKRQAWRSVNGTLGVTSLVMEGLYPRPVPKGVVEDLTRAADTQSYVHFGEELGVGDTVRVLTGPFADLVGTLVRLDGAERAQILLGLLGGSVRASVERRDLVAA